MKSKEKPWGRMKTSEEAGSVTGEITPLPEAPPSETERAVDIGGRHTVEEWLVFVEEEIGPVADTVKDSIKRVISKDIITLTQFTEFLAQTMEKKKQIDMNVINALHELDKTK